jgi:hypothetical protein
MYESINFSTDKCVKYPNNVIRTQQLHAIVQKLVDMIVLEESMKSYKASDIACAVVYLAREELEVVPLWRKELTSLMKGTNPSSAQVIKITNELRRVISNIPPAPEEEALIPQSPVPQLSHHSDSPEGKGNDKVGPKSPLSVANSDVLSPNH